MAKVLNTFLKSKMNKDLDARIVPNGEYRDALNVQVSKSEGSEVGVLENVLGNIPVISLALAGSLKCIGNFADEINSTVYLFLTNNSSNQSYDPNADHYVVAFNTLSQSSVILLKGSFLNFSKQNLITGVNILEGLLFWTDNLNQPRVIDVNLANPTNSLSPSHYTTEDQISVAKYNPYQCMELYKKSFLGATASVPYETTMKDVSSKFLPNGGLGLKTGPYTGTAEIILDAGSVVGDIMNPNGPYGTTATIGYIPSSGGNIITIAGAALDASIPPFYDAATNTWKITITGGIFPDVPTTEVYEIIINPNPYYDSVFSGDKDYLEDKFVRFSYRFKFEDNTYSIFAPFTQIAFIPKQDGYFMYIDETGLQEVNDEAETYRSTVVYFVENKVNDINLRIPLPYINYQLQEALKIKSIDILYKESDGLAVRAIETIPIQDIANSSGTCFVNGNQTPTPAGTPIAVFNVQGNLNVGDIVRGFGVPDNTVVVSFTSTTNLPNAGDLVVNNAITALSNGDLLIVGDINYFEYNYKSTKPTKTIAESELIRVYDKVPVKALAQEVSGNRVMYGNFINKIDPPAFIDYNVACTEKCEFEVGEVFAGLTGTGTTIGAGTTIQILLNKLYAPPSGLFAGMVITSNNFGVTIPANTVVTSTDNNGQVGSGTQVANITLNQDVIFPPNAIVLIFEPGSSTENCVSTIEYPNHSVKQNRNYQVGFVLSDRYGRSSSVILSNSKKLITVNGISYTGSTLYSPYIDESVDKDEWRGNSIKILVNAPITDNVYDGDVASTAYNPLGWYSYKVVVKQTEQEYYNVYLPGIMAGYPQEKALEIGKTSHAVLINDNINKVPRDLTEVGPEQKQFRSSIQLFGRVENTATIIIDTNTGASNTQYYPDTNSDTVSTIATAFDLFDFNPSEPFQPNFYPQFYSLDSNPLIARISTESKIGQIASTNYSPAACTVAVGQNVNATNIITVANITGTINPNDLVIGGDLPEGVYVGLVDLTVSPPEIFLKLGVSNYDAEIPEGTNLTFTPSTGPTSFDPKLPGIQYLAVYETEPVVSLLDIFWETSTSGLLSDLNSTIINNQLDPAPRNIGGWNDDPFDEGLPKQANILAAPFRMTDDFGADIVLTPAMIAAGDGLVLSTVLNGNGQVVFGDANTPISTPDYFRLVDTSTGQTGVGPWQIRTTDILDVPLNFYDYIFYMYNTTGQDTNGLRNFTFIFDTIVGGQSVQLTETAVLSNVTPYFTKVTQGTDSIIAGSPLIYPNIPVSPNAINCEAKRNSKLVASVESLNGANNPVLALLDKAYVGYTNFTPPSPYIYRQKIGSVAEDAPDALLGGEPIFELTPSGDLLNRMFQNSSLPAKTYYVIIRVRDAGDEQDIIIEVDMSLDLPTDIIKNKVAHGFFGMLGPGNWWSAVGTPATAPLQPGPFGPTSGFGFTGGVYQTRFNSDSSGGAIKYNTPAGHPYTLIDTSAGGIPGLNPDQFGYFAYAGGFFNNQFPSQFGFMQGQMATNPFTRFSDSLTQRYGVSSSLPLGDPPIIIPWNVPDTYGHKVIRPDSPNMLEFGTPGSAVGTAKIMVYGIATISNMKSSTLANGNITKNFQDQAEPRGACTITMDSGKFPHNLMRFTVVPQGTAGLPYMPSNSVCTYPVAVSGSVNNNKNLVWNVRPDSTGQTGDIDFMGSLVNMTLQGGGVDGNTERVNYTPKDGDKIYFFGGELEEYRGWADWWNNSENGYYGSPWYFNTDLDQLERTLNYSPWVGPGTLWYCFGSGGGNSQDTCNQTVQFAVNNPTIKHTLPENCTNSPGQIGTNYLATVTYAGIEGEVQNYSNLEWSLT